MTPKRGRPKIVKFKDYDAPHNFYYWKWILKEPETVNAFLNRGSKQQKDIIKEILVYLKRADKDFFEKVNGEEVLKEIL